MAKRVERESRETDVSDKGEKKLKSQIKKEGREKVGESQGKTHKQCDVWVKSGRGVGGDTSAIKIQ